MERNYILEGTFILLGLAAIAAVIKYPKDTFITIPLGILKLLWEKIWRFISLPLIVVGMPLVYFGEKYNWKLKPTISKLIDFGTTDNDDKPYKATKTLKVDFKNGDKYLFVFGATKDLKGSIADFLEALTEKHSIEDFEIAVKGNQQIISFPKNINFHDYHLLVQYFNGETGDEKSFGLS